MLENSPRVNFPVVAPDPEKNSDIKYLIYAGGNRGRGKFILPVTK
jgi:hypothetical protein